MQHSSFGSHRTRSVRCVLSSRSKQINPAVGAWILPARRNLNLPCCAQCDQQGTSVVESLKDEPVPSSGPTHSDPLPSPTADVRELPYNAFTSSNQERTDNQPFLHQTLEDVSNRPIAADLQNLAASALLISPFFFWGTSMVAMKEVLPHATPLLISTLRLLPAGLVLVGWAAATGRQQPQTPIAWAWITVFALVDAAAFQGFLAEGLQRTPAGLGSVIIDSQPLSVAVMAAILFGEQLLPAGIAGLFLGVAGLLLLEVPQAELLAAVAQLGTEPVNKIAKLAAELITTPVMSSVAQLAPAAVSTAPSADMVLAASVPMQMSSFTVASTMGSGDGWSIWDSGECWMLLAAQAMAVGTVMVRQVAKHCDPFMATGWHMILGGVMLLGFILTTDADSIPTSLAQFQVEDVLAMAYVSLLGGAASYGVFFDNATRGNLTALSSLTFLTPMFAAAGGFLLLQETLTPLQLTGAGITLTAVYLINK